MATKHPSPNPNFDYIGKHHYALTWNCDYRQTHFTQADRVELVLQQFLRACAEAKFEIVAYSFMPDHVHKLIHGTDIDSDGRRYIALAKQYSGYYFKKAHHQKLWQRYGRDDVLPDDEAVRRAVRYIIENPVRARIVNRAEDYPFTGSMTHTVKELIEWGNRNESG